MRKPPHLRDDDDEIGDTYQSIAMNTLPDAGGRFAGYGEPNNIGATNKYPSVAETPLTRPTVEQGFVPDRDCVDEPTTDRFGVDITRLPGAPPLEPPPANSSSPDSKPIKRCKGSAFCRRV